jgi:hypothetical protein
MLMSFGDKPEERILNFIAMVDCMIYSERQLAEGKWRNYTLQYDPKMRKDHGYIK